MKSVEQDNCNLCLVRDKKGKPVGGNFCKDFIGGREVFRRDLTVADRVQFWSARSAGSIADCGKYQESMKLKNTSPEAREELV